MSRPSNPLLVYHVSRYGGRVTTRHLSLLGAVDAAEGPGGDGRIAVTYAPSSVLFPRMWSLTGYMPQAVRIAHDHQVTEFAVIRGRMP